MTHKECVKRAGHWLASRLAQNNSKEKFSYLYTDLVLCEPAGYCFGGWKGELPDVYGIRLDMSVNIECKVSRSDFLSDKNKKHDHPHGNYKIFACPNGMITPDELPENWGLLYIKPFTCKLVVEPKFQETEHHIAYSAVIDILRNIHMHGDLFHHHLRRPKSSMWDGRPIKLENEGAERNASTTLSIVRKMLENGKTSAECLAQISKYKRAGQDEPVG